MDVDHLRGWIGRTHAADDHAAKGGFLPPVPLPRRMWAGGAVETLAPLRLDDTVVRRSTVEGVATQHGRTGPLVFVTMRHDVSTERGPAIRERHDIVYRDAPAPGPAHPEPPPAEPRAADLAWEVEGSPVLLFRYSALTLNGHRIHDDLPYVTAVEGYAGLLVHGPIQATLCFNLAASLLGRVPRHYAFRNTMPLVAGPAVGVAGVRTARRSAGPRGPTEGCGWRPRLRGEAAAEAWSDRPARSGHRGGDRVPIRARRPVRLKGCARYPNRTGGAACSRHIQREPASPCFDV